MTDRHLPEFLDALGQSFGGTWDEQWFAWKHRSSPNGPSHAWVAVDDSGVIGIRLLLPWTFVDGETQVAAVRPCDTVTLPRARRSGVFRALTTHALKSLPTSTDLVFNTPNEESRPGYLKMGFQPWAFVDQRIAVVKRAKASLLSGPSALPPSVERPGLATRTDLDFLKWRYLSIPHRRYEIEALREADAATGAIYRVRPWKGVRLLLMLEIWGPLAAQHALLGAIARKESSRLVLVEDAHREALSGSWPIAPTIVTHKNLSARTLSAPAFSIGDIEDVL